MPPRKKAAIIVEAPIEAADETPIPSTDGPADPFFALPHANIVPDADNARKVFDAAKLADLAATIATHGLLQPILVTPGESALVWRLVAGERRWRAIALLIAEGRWEPGRLVPCRLADQQMREARIASEAEAFAAEPAE